MKCVDGNILPCTVSTKTAGRGIRALVRLQPLWYVENKLLSTIAIIKRIKKCIPPSQYMKIYHSLFESHLTYGISCWGGSYKSKFQKIFCLQKRCIRILCGRTYSFDHHEFYYSCARTKTYTEHMAQKDFNLEHTKPLFVKNYSLTIHNLYNNLKRTVRTFLQLETCSLQRVSMTTQNGARRSCTWARRIISDYIFRVAILSNITLHYRFLRIIIWTTRLLYCPQLCP